MGAYFPFEKSDAKLYVADGVGGSVAFSHSGGKVNILRTSRALLSFVTCTYITDILLRVI